jgi:transposase-like protein
VTRSGRTPCGVGIQISALERKPRKRLGIEILFFWGAAAAERFLTKALGGENHPAPRVINTDKHAAYPPAIVELKTDGVLEEKCTHRPVQYLNNVLEQDHRAIKRRVRASQHFRSFWGAWRTIVGYEAIHMIRKGQAYGSAAGAKVGLLHRFILGLFAAAN